MLHMCDLLIISWSSLLIHSRLQADALSELFVWDDVLVLVETENKVTKLARDWATSGQITLRYPNLCSFI